MRLGCDLFRNGGSVIVHLLSLCLSGPLWSTQVKCIRAKVEAQGLSSSNSFISRRIIMLIKLAELLKDLVETCSFNTTRRSQRKCAPMGLLTIQRYLRPVYLCCFSNWAWRNTGSEDPLSTDGLCAAPLCVCVNKGAGAWRGWGHSKEKRA